MRLSPRLKECLLEGSDRRLEDWLTRFEEAGDCNLDPKSPCTASDFVTQMGQLMSGVMACAIWDSEGNQYTLMTHGRGWGFMKARSPCTKVAFALDYFRDTYTHITKTCAVDTVSAMPCPNALLQCSFQVQGRDA